MIRDGRSVADSPETARGLQLFSDIRWQHHIAPQPGESADFFRGTLATYYTWMSETPNRYNTVGGAFTVDLVTMPSGPAGRFHPAGGCPVTVSATTAHPEEAYKFATWFAVDSDELEIAGDPGFNERHQTSIPRLLGPVLRFTRRAHRRSFKPDRSGAVGAPEDHRAAGRMDSDHQRSGLRYDQRCRSGGPDGAQYRGHHW